MRSTQRFLLIFLLFFIPAIVTAQKKKLYKSRLIHLTLPDKTIEAEVLLKKKVKPKRKRTYYWSDTRGIYQTQGGYSYYLLDGSYTAYYYPGNQLKEKGKFRNGVKDGIWLTWFSNGKLKDKVHWKNGIIDGNMEIYNSDGTSSYITTYRNGSSQNEESSSKDTTALRRESFFHKSFYRMKGKLNKVFRRKNLDEKKQKTH